METSQYAGFEFDVIEVHLSSKAKYISAKAPIPAAYKVESWALGGRHSGSRAVTSLLREV